MRGVVLPKNVEGEVVLVPLDVAVRRQVAAWRAPRDEVFAGQERECARVVSIGKVDLGQPERVAVAV